VCAIVIQDWNSGMQSGPAIDRTRNHGSIVNVDVGGHISWRIEIGGGRGRPPLHGQKLFLGGRRQQPIQTQIHGRHPVMISPTAG
jgi:hypothetical protein